MENLSYLRRMRQLVLAEEKAQGHRLLSRRREFNSALNKFRHSKDTREGAVLEGGGGEQETKKFTYGSCTETDSTTKLYFSEVKPHNKKEFKPVVMKRDTQFKVVTPRIQVPRQGDEYVLLCPDESVVQYGKPEITVTRNNIETTTWYFSKTVKHTLSNIEIRVNIPKEIKFLRDISENKIFEHDEEGTIYPVVHLLPELKSHCVEEEDKYILQYTIDDDVISKQSFAEGKFIVGKLASTPPASYYLFVDQDGYEIRNLGSLPAPAGIFDQGVEARDGYTPTWETVGQPKKRQKLK